VPALRLARVPQPGQAISNEPGKPGRHSRQPFGHAHGDRPAQQGKAFTDTQCRRADQVLPRKVPTVVEEVRVLAFEFGQPVRHLVGVQVGNNRAEQPVKCRFDRAEVLAANRRRIRHAAAKRHRGRRCCRRRAAADRSRGCRVKARPFDRGEAAQECTSGAERRLGPLGERRCGPALAPFDQGHVLPTEVGGDAELTLTPAALLPPVSKVTAEAGRRRPVARG
jgi:hypothetical protein